MSRIPCWRLLAGSCQVHTNFDVAESFSSKTTLYGSAPIIMLISTKQPKAMSPPTTTRKARGPPHHRFSHGSGVICLRMCKPNK